MSILGKLFGSEKALEASVGALRDGLDALVYTEEEKASDASVERSKARSHLIDWMNATQGQNLTRRYLVVVLSGIWGLQYLTAWGLSFASIWAVDPERIIQAAELTKEGANQMNGAMMLILSFYFAAPHMDKIVNTAMDKFKGN